MYEYYCKARDIMGYKDSDVSKKTGIPPSTFSDWKSGRSNPKDEKLRKIAKVLGVSIEYLRTGKDPEATTDIPYYVNDDAKEMAQFLFDNPQYKVLFDASRKVKVEDIEFVKEMIERFSGNNK